MTIISEILTGYGNADFDGIGVVWYELTWKERWELLVACVKAFNHPDAAIADFISSDLEDLLSGYKPERYVQ